MSGAEFFDPAWEFDCPKFRDFRVCSDGEEELDGDEALGRRAADAAADGGAEADWFDLIRATAVGRPQRREEGEDETTKKKAGETAGTEGKRGRTAFAASPRPSPQRRGSRPVARREGKTAATGATAAAEEADKENRQGQPKASAQRWQARASLPPPPSKPSAVLPPSRRSGGGTESGGDAAALTPSTQRPTAASFKGRKSGVGGVGSGPTASTSSSTSSLSYVDARVEGHLQAVAVQAKLHFPSFAPPPERQMEGSDGSSSSSSSSRQTVHRRAASHGRPSPGAVRAREAAASSASASTPSSASRRSSSLPNRHRRRSSSVPSAPSSSAALLPRGPSSLTVPVSPPLLTAGRRRPSHPSALHSRESLELQTMEAERERQRRRVAVNGRAADVLFALSHRPTSAAAPALPLRSQTPLTRPAEFRLSTAERAAKATAVGPAQPTAAIASSPPPVSQRFQQCGELGVPRVHKRPLTTTRPFVFHTAQKAASRAQETVLVSGPSSTRSLPPASGLHTPAPFHLRTEERGARKVPTQHPPTRAAVGSAGCSALLSPLPHLSPSLPLSSSVPRSVLCSMRWLRGRRRRRVGCVAPSTRGLC